jgi:hypothetical protein
LHIARLFYFCEMDLLNEIHEHIVSKTYFEVSTVKIEYYYKKVYGKELNKKCSQCIIDAHTMLKRYFHANKKIDTFTSEDKFYLKLALFRFKEQGKESHIEWIKNKLKEL